MTSSAEERKEETDHSETPDYLGHGLMNSEKVLPEDHPFLNKDEDLSDAQDGKIVRLLTKEAHKGNRPEDGALVECSVRGVVVSSGVEFENRTFEFEFGRGAITDGLEIALASTSQEDEATVTIHPEHSTFLVDQRKYADAAFLEQKSKRIVPPAGEIVRYAVQMLYVENRRARGLRQDLKNAHATRLKEEGNEYFGMKRYHTSIRKYQKAIEYTYEDPPEEVMKVLEEMAEEKGTRLKDINITEPLPATELEEAKKQQPVIARQIQLNLCAVRNKLKQYQEAIEGCNLILKTDKENVKALFRRGQAYLGQKKYKKAKEDFRRILELDSENSDAKKQLTKVETLEAQEERKRRQVYKRMVSGISEEGVTPAAAPSGGFVDRFITSFFAGGVTQTHLWMLNGCFFLLLLLSAYLIVVRGVGIHGYIFLLLLIGLFLSVQWVLLVGYAPPPSTSSSASEETVIEDAKKDN